VKHFCAEAGEEEMIINVERRRNAMPGITFTREDFFVVNICCHISNCPFILRVGPRSKKSEEENVAI
jgi:hypothetical protein